MSLLTRRHALRGSLAGSALLLSGCGRILGADAATGTNAFDRLWHATEAWTQDVQRFLLGNGALAREYKPSEISSIFYANGTTNPGGAVYDQAVRESFANWRLRIDGMVSRPMSLSIGDLRRLPQRTQITRHDCVEGWSAIAQWTGVPLGFLLHAAGAQPGARYVVFFCADNLDGEPQKGGEQAPGQYYESIAMVDALHPQTIIAYDMNNRPLDVAHGAPLRLRVERQLGYKQAKYVMRISLVDSLARINGGNGGYWEDRGYDWYAGI